MDLKLDHVSVLLIYFKVQHGIPSIFPSVHEKKTQNPTNCFKQQNKSDEYAETHFIIACFAIPNKYL